MTKRYSGFFFLLGLFIWILSFMVPSGMLDAFGSLKPVGLATVFICPVIGIIGIVFAVREKKYGRIFLNLLLVFSFFITMFFGTYFAGVFNG